MEYLTIRLKDIIKSDFNEFLEQINNYGFNRVFLVDAEILKIIYDVLKIKYCNSYIRYETANLFLNALEMRIFNIAPIYQQKIYSLKEALTTFKNDFLTETESISENNTIKQYGVSNDNFKSADTPTTIINDFALLDKYINNASASNKDYSNTLEESKNKVRDKDVDIMEKLNKLQKLRFSIYEELSAEFNDLFMQIY